MISYIKNLVQINTFLTLASLLIIVKPLLADTHSSFKQVEATGRAILLGAPFWKKEIVNGEPRWVDAKPEYEDALSRW